MKMAFIINSLEGGGAERIVQILSNYFVEKGNYEIYIILLEKAPFAYEINKQVNIITLKTSILTKGFGKLLSIPFQSIELNYILNKFKIYYAISFLVRANFVYSLVKVFSNKKVIISERSFSYLHYKKNNIKNNIMNFLIKTLYPKADLIIAISNGVQKSLEKYYLIPKNKIKTIYNLQNINDIKNYKINNTSFKFEKNIKYFITLGRLIDLKDHRTMIKAFKKVNNRNQNTKLLILGEGPLKNELENLILKLGLKGNVVLLGFKEEPFAYLKQADIFILSSKFEGFGNVIIEAMACGLPIIATNCPGGPAEILDNGKYGILAEVNNIDQLSDAMIEMLKKENINNYKKLSLKRAEDFDVSIIANKYLNVFNLGD